jgi:hypothetical protein
MYSSVEQTRPRCLDGDFPDCLILPQLTSISDLPLEILEQIIGYTVAGRHICASECANPWQIANRIRDRTRMVFVPCLVNRKFYHASRTSILPNVTLRATEVQDIQSWLRGMSGCPAGAIRSLEISWWLWNQLMYMANPPDNTSWRSRLALKVMNAMLGGLRMIRFTFVLWEAFDIKTIRDSIAEHCFLHKFLGCIMWDGSIDAGVQQCVRMMVRNARLDSLRRRKASYSDSAGDSELRRWVPMGSAGCHIMLDVPCVIGTEFALITIRWKDAEIEIRISPEERLFIITARRREFEYMRHLPVHGYFHLPVTDTEQELRKIVESTLVWFLYQRGMVDWLPDDLIEQGSETAQMPRIRQELAN